MTPERREQAVRETETWFVRRGLPFFVEDRTIDVNDLVHGRSLAVLVVAYFGSLLLAVPADEPWTTRLLYSGIGLLLLLAVWALANLIRHRRAMERPRRIGVVELAIIHELETAVGVRAAYLALRRRTLG